MCAENEKKEYYNYETNNSVSKKCVWLLNLLFKIDKRNVANYESCLI